MFGFPTDSGVFFTLSLAEQARRMMGALVEGRLGLPLRTRKFGPIGPIRTRYVLILLKDNIGHSDIVRVTTLCKIEPRLCLTGGFFCP